MASSPVTTVTPIASFSGCARHGGTPPEARLPINYSTWKYIMSNHAIHTYTRLNDLWCVRIIKKNIHLRYLGLVVTLESSDPALPLACQCRRWPPQAEAGWNSENPSDFGDCGAALSFSLSETHHFWSSHFSMQNTSDHYHDRLEKSKKFKWKFTGCSYTRIWINHMQSTSSSLFSGII